MNQSYMQIGILAFFIILMYVLLIRPQKAKQKKVDNFRANLSVGDEVYTIGGIRGKIVRISDETVILQTGNDRVRMEIARWGIMQYVDSTASNAPQREKAEEEQNDVAEERVVKPKRMGGSKNADSAPVVVEQPVPVEDAVAEEKAVSEEPTEEA